MNAYNPVKTFIGLKNYVDIFNSGLFYRALLNNTYYAIISLVIQVGGGLVLAIILTSSVLGDRSRKVFRNIYFLPSLIAIAAVGLMFYFIYHPTAGLLNGLINLMGAHNFSFPWLGNAKTAIFAIIGMSQWQWTGYDMLLLIVAIQKIPKELYEVADIYGASAFQKAIYVTIPQIKGMILVVTILTVSGAYKLFTEVFITTRGAPYDSSHVLGSLLYKHAFFYDQMGYAAAIATIIFVITFSTSVLQVNFIGTGKE